MSINQKLFDLFRAGFLNQECDAAFEGVRVGFSVFCFVSKVLWFPVNALSILIRSPYNVRQWPENIDLWNGAGVREEEPAAYFLLLNNFKTMFVNQGSTKVFLRLGKGFRNFDTGCITYLCERAISRTVKVETKKQAYMWNNTKLALPETKSRISQLAAKTEQQKSHWYKMLHD